MLRCAHVGAWVGVGCARARAGAHSTRGSGRGRLAHPPPHHAPASPPPRPRPAPQVGGAILADEMGLGKTAQAICFLGALADWEGDKCAGGGGG